jgi:hypothetical protein
MTAAPVMSITDELITELEYTASQNHAYVPVNPPAMRALLAERAELVRDRERLDWLVKEEAFLAEIYCSSGGTMFALCWPNLSSWQADHFNSPREAIDAALQAAQ